VNCESIKTLFGPNIKGPLSERGKLKGTFLFREENQIVSYFKKLKILRGLVPYKRENSMGRFCSSIPEEIEQGLSFQDHKKF